MGRSRRGRPAPWRAALDRFRLTVAVVVCCATGLGLAVSGSFGAGPIAAAAANRAVDPCAPAWVTGWQAAPQAAPTEGGLVGATLRMIIRPQLAGGQVRVRLSNAYGRSPLEVGAVSVAHAGAGAEPVPGSAAPVTFDGGPRVLIAAGAEITSDPLPFAAEPNGPVAVSLYLTELPDTLTRHAVALQTSYLSGPGDATLTGGADFPTTLSSGAVLTGLDVLAARPVNGLVAVGDSITGGAGNGVGVAERWTDALARRLTDPAAAPEATMVVLNAGIGGNRLLGDDPVDGGDSPLTRFDRDVGAAAGATDVVLQIGTNDIAVGRTATEIVEGLQRYLARARAAGVRVFLTTITPSAAGAHGTGGAVAARSAVNAWVRAYGPTVADGVFDFAAAVRDPQQPDRLAPAFDSGDGLHLSAAGYRALAEAVDPGLLSGSPCLAGSRPAATTTGG
ncbi:MAG TPA: GDSL-type esterase/lipase family protein [Pseudonocardia sp.]|nr:GDSL-type esterase/lipase family protein [Pseudonocardia sp.]